ncbi:hypothetical protein SGRIM128S_06017 [Streptomyces griseomycini]
MRLVYVLSSATALYSSGPVTPSRWKAPRSSWWPRERHSRAVSTSSSPHTGVVLEALVAGGLDVADDGVGDVGVDVEGGGAVGQYAEPSEPSMVRQGNAAPRRPSWAARSRATGRVECCQRSASAAASGAVQISRGSTKTSVSV